PTSPLALPSPMDAPGPIDSPDAERARSDEAAAREAGFSLRPPIFALGTAVNATGERNFRQSRRAFEELPFADDACAALARTVEGERRTDLVCDAPALVMQRDGRLSCELGALPLSERALDGLGRLVTPGGVGYLASCPPDLRALNVNHWLAGARRRGKDGAIVPRQVTLRARPAARGCGGFAIVRAQAPLPRVGPPPL